MNILIIGSGGREDALAWIINKSPLCSQLFIAPGNGGTQRYGTNLSIAISDFAAIEQAVVQHQIDFVIAGPEDPVINDIEGYFRHSDILKNVPVLAPSARGAQLEGSKHFAKLFMQRHLIPTAAYRTFTLDEYDHAAKYISSHTLPVVIKADGLAAGKGVTVAHTHDEAMQALNESFVQKRFGNAGDKVVVEAFLDGIEMSAFVLTDGKRYMLLPEAKDYKQIGDGNTGPNTGGMGAVSPVAFAGRDFMDKVIHRIIEPTIKGLEEEEITYRGFIFFGLMNVKGEPYVIEYNVRLGDPEAEAILPRLDEDMVPFLLEAAQGNLSRKEIKLKPDYSVTVMMVSEGYPGTYETGKDISGIAKLHDANVFIAGAKNNEKGLISSGGRVLAVNSLGIDLESTIRKTYREVEKVSFEGCYYRKDIGKDLMEFSDV